MPCTKDRDFRDSQLLRGTPRRLLIVATGNIANDDLLTLFERHLETNVSALEVATFAELDSDRLVVHGRPVAHAHAEMGHRERPWRLALVGWPPRVLENGSTEEGTVMHGSAPSFPR